MLRTHDLLAIALALVSLGLASLGLAAPAHSREITTVRPVEMDAGRLPLPPRVPKVLPTYCETHNCLMPPRPQPDR